ncbi:uncharacterized protein LACBIDRAFT_333821 [Laccaria bicolor S238N-H82]|uniref:Predicted protein n=1 Tax=Laccaria bicolor (strain S238N-H82 / ATCC MYA-4686) TaxID=486041 RepID=B0DX66_LACBS|nr:uncharacterized protein LACBIDRAFT_333821 [Laccaria bicolor S238N-H82]EDR00779.1 predicted protein [Laccaria bicolor S238N-H82]|eukprot:XP_001888571.1 predicted protein [Laccaria bicolor S238N-H82]
MPTGDGAHEFKNIAGQASLDGQGGTEPPSQMISASEHRNIYYRLYTKGGPLESNNPIFSNDRSISRISSKSVRPPRTAASLKRYVCKIEGVEGPEKSALYLSLSEKKPVDDSVRLALRGNSGPGSSEVDPVVFVVDKGVAEKRPKSAIRAYPRRLAELANHIGCPPLVELTRRFLYDQLHTDDGTSSADIPIQQCPYPTGRVSVFHSAVATFYAPSDESGIRGMRTERIRSTPSWRKHGPRRDCALVVEDQDKPGMKGMSVVRVKLLFSFEYDGKTYPCALVDWFKRVGASPDPETGMWKLKRAKPHKRRQTMCYLADDVCKIEGVEGPEKSALYLSLSGTKPVDDSARITPRGNSGSGSSEVDPVVFVVDKGAAEKRPKSASNAGSNELPAQKIEQRYVYYRLYDDDGEVVSKTSFDESDSSLGRIDIFTIPPPHTVASLKDRLIHVEGVLGHDVQLLENEDGEVTLNDGDVISLLTDNCPGSKEGQPIVFTYARNGSDKTTAPGTHPSFSKRLTASRNWAGASHDAAWHSVAAGEILQTDGVFWKESLYVPPVILWFEGGTFLHVIFLQLFTQSLEISLG